VVNTDVKVIKAPDASGGDLVVVFGINGGGYINATYGALGPTLPGRFVMDGLLSMVDWSSSPMVIGRPVVQS
jgi:hypothetical protein